MSQRHKSQFVLDEVHETKQNPPFLFKSINNYSPTDKHGKKCVESIYQMQRSKTKVLSCVTVGK